MALFSRRNSPKPSEIRYDIPRDVRSRLLHSIDGWSHGDVHLALEEVERTLLQEYGGLSSSRFEAARVSDSPLINHFMSCRDEKVLDFLEALFQASHYGGGQEGVDRVVKILREHGIGYDFTPLIVEEKSVTTHMFGVPHQAIQLHYQYPEAYRVDHEILHQEVIGPVVSLLSDSRLVVASKEFREALRHHRSGQHAEAITACASAFESVLKTICDLKRWRYDPDKDTCAGLVDVCQRHGLFPSFYTDLFKRTGTIRNKLGSAHGRGPTQSFKPDSIESEHLLYMTGSQIIALCRWAGLR